MEARVWKQILGEEIYNKVDHTACEKLKEQLYQECDSCLHQIYEEADSYYSGNLPDINFENFYRFFQQIAVNYAEVWPGISAFGKEAECMIADNVLQGIIRIPVRCLIADIRGCAEQGKLSGKDEWEEYADYEERFLRSPEYIKQLCGSYPELLRVLLLRIRQIVSQLYLIRDVAEGVDGGRGKGTAIRKNGGARVRIADIELGLSDVHTAGRTAGRVQFTGGEKFIYKPRSLRKDKIYQDINRWFCTHLKINVRDRDIIEAGNGGFDEYVECRPCQDEAEVRRFFYRLGIQLLICYLTDTSDIHGENLIADGEYPWLVDLETMPGAVQPGRRRDSEIERIREYLECSVLHTGILPGATWGDKSAGGGVNVLHSSETCVTPFKLPVISNPRSSGIGIEYERKKITLRNSIPYYQGKPVNVQKYVQELCCGFRDAYRLALDRKDELAGVFEPLFQESSRYLLRHTQQYDMYMSVSLSPEFMKNTKDRIYLLHVLRKTEKKNSGQAVFFDYELRSLMNLEIPVYHFEGKELDLRDGDGRGYPGYFEQSAYEGFQSRLLGLSVRDLRKQEMMIRLSMGCNLPHMEESRYICTKDLMETDRHIFAKGMTEESEGASSEYPEEGDGYVIGKCPGREKDILEGITRHIAGLRVRLADCPGADSRNLPWERPIFSRLNLSGPVLRVEAAGMNLYDGLPGIAVLLAAVRSVCKTDEFDDLYGALTGEMFRYTGECLAHMKERTLEGTGMFVGEGSVVYGYLLLYQADGRAEYLDYARKHTEVVREISGWDSCFDLLSGNAGWILVLLRLYQITAEERYLSDAVRAGETLWEKRTELETGCGWICSREKTPLAGMAHGNSGAVLAYAGLLEHTGSQEYIGRIRRLMEYEDSLYSAREENWLDLRVQKRAGSHSNAWCHGGSGILLSRIRLAGLEEFREDERVRVDIERGLKCLMKWEEDDSYCLCHGLAGKYLIMKECAGVLGREDLAAESGRMRRRLLEAVRIPVQEFYSASLMSGIGGVNFALSGLASGFLG